MQVEQHAIGSVLTLDDHPLLHTVDVDEDLFREAARQRFPILIHERFGTAGVAPEHQ
jgi:hypothetical protein